MFAKLRTLLKRAAERSVEGLWTTIGKLLGAPSAEPRAPTTPPSPATMLPERNDSNNIWVKADLQRPFGPEEQLQSDLFGWPIFKRSCLGSS